jgi:serine phosphatase RsbU (regulator of sigma subunit)
VSIRDGQMASVGEIIQILSGAELVEGVMDLALQVLLSRFGALRAWVGVRRVNYGPMEYVAGQLSTGQTYELSEWGENLKPRILDRSQFVLIPIIDPKETTTIMAGPMAGTEGLLGMVYLDRDTSRGAYTAADLDFFTIVVSLIGAQVDAILKQLAKNRAAMMAGEVSVAHAIQARLTPRKLAVWPEELQFGAFREPGEAHSNNIYDIVKLGNGMAMFMVAHTPATGWAPCMLISQAQSTFRYAAMHQDAPHVYLKSLNWILCDGQRDHDLCMIVGVIDPGSGQVHYSVAGRTPACIIDTRGEERHLMPAQELPPLGADRAANYPYLTEQLEETETLAVFTPGVNSARNTAGEILGEDRLLEILCDGFGQSASALLKDLFNDVTSYIENGKQPEDITVVLAHRL